MGCRPRSVTLSLSLSLSFFLSCNRSHLQDKIVRCVGKMAESNRSLQLAVVWIFIQRVVGQQFQSCDESPSCR
uniref:Putative secreted protein n=1 Tax=Ixodes ricinus TaxID=34613 RepID=A0A147BUF4_IXORI